MLVKKPVYLTSENFHLVHEPKKHSATISAECFEDSLMPELPPVDQKWDGYWGGSEERKILYLKEQSHLWAWLRESEVKRQTGAFFTPRRPVIDGCETFWPAWVRIGAPRTRSKQFYRGLGILVKYASGRRVFTLQSQM